LPNLPSAHVHVLACLIAYCLAPSAWALQPPAHPLKSEPAEIVTRSGVKRFRVEIADTAATREYGLMKRRHLAADHGMLFDFKTPQPVAFWMKDTLIPLDMLFIARDGRIVSIARNATPMSETPIPSQGVILGVLEIRGGRAAEIGAQPGDRVVERIFGH